MCVEITLLAWQRIVTCCAHPAHLAYQRAHEQFVPAIRADRLETPIGRVPARVAAPVLVGLGQGFQKWFRGVAVFGSGHVEYVAIYSRSQHRRDRPLAVRPPGANAASRAGRWFRTEAQN